MVLMDLKLDNFCAFNDFHINFSYPRKLNSSFVDGEYLSEFPNFRYKKVNIIMGANASGKTSLGYLIMLIFNFISKKEISKLIDNINDKKKESYFKIDFVSTNYSMMEKFLYRVCIKIIPSDNEDDFKVLSYVNSKKIRKKDSYESCKEELDNISENYVENYIEELGKISSFGWFFIFPNDTKDMRKLKFPTDDKIFPTVLKTTLMALDVGIKDVRASTEIENSYIISFDNREIMLQDGELLEKDKDILSSGTKAGIEISCMISSIINRANGFYYCDEKFSYIHTDLEKAFLILMIEKLGEDEQLFFTTHNSDILDIPLPKHSFTFLKKENDGDRKKIISINAASYLNNDSSLRDAVNNDLFSTSPSSDLIYDLEELNPEAE